MIECKICGRRFKSITNSHLKKHNITVRDYISKYNTNIFSKGQRRYFDNYLPWNKGLRGVQKAWNKNSCNVDHSFFKRSSEDMFYILGLLFADGCITRHRKGGKIVSLSLQEGDIDLINKVAKILSYKKNIYEYFDKRYKSKLFKIDIYSEEMFDDLKKLGCVEQKTNKIRFPKMDTKYFRDFIRGYFDGDGSLFTSNNKLKVSITCGSLLFLNDLNEVVKEVIDIEFKGPYKKKGECWFICINKINHVRVFLDFIYKGSTTYMNRKYDKYRVFEL